MGSHTPVTGIGTTASLIESRQPGTIGLSVGLVRRNAILVLYFLVGNPSPIDCGRVWGWTASCCRVTSASARVYFVDSPNYDEECLALLRPKSGVKYCQIEAADTDERHPPNPARYRGN